MVYKILIVTPVCSTMLSTELVLVYSSTYRTVKFFSSICSTTSAMSAGDGSPSGSKP